MAAFDLISFTGTTLHCDFSGMTLETENIILFHSTYHSKWKMKSMSEKNILASCMTFQKQNVASYLR